MHPMANVVGIGDPLERHADEKVGPKSEKTSLEKSGKVETLFGH
jgi:hypothetical protein